MALLAVGVLGAGGQWVLPRACNAIRTHPYFALGEIVVHRRGRMSESAVREATNLRLGMSIWDLDAARIRTDLERLPWVRSARVRRELPRRVVIRIREHRPAAIVHVAGERRPLRYVSASAHVFAPVEPGDGRDLPYLTGLDPADGQWGRGGPTLRLAMATLRRAARHRDALGAVSEVHVDPAAGLTLLPVRPAVPIVLGWDDIHAKMARIAEVLPLWSRRDASVHSVRVSDDEQVIIRLRAVPREWGA